MDIAGEIGRFLADRRSKVAEARQRAALQLVCGIDLDLALAAPREEMARTLARLQRMIERERLKGARRHWSYDLNRHIALKQAALRLCEALGKPSAKRPGRVGNGAANAFRHPRPTAPDFR